MHIAIVAGGYSSEHEVSLRSAAGLMEFIPENYKKTLVEVFEDRWEAVEADGQRYLVDKNDFSYKKNGEQVNFDYAYITIHGTPGEDGILAAYFSLIGIPYSSCEPLVAGLSFNKYTCNQYLKGFGISVADNMMLRPGECTTAAEVENAIGWPCFVKSTVGGSSYGVTKVHGPEELDKAIELAREQGGEVLIESFLQGTEISNGCYMDSKGNVHALPISEVVSEDEFFDYDAKYNGKVQEITPARLSDELTRRVQETTERIYKILGCRGIIRIDYIITAGDKINLLEMNMTPGMTVTSFIPQQVAAEGLDIHEVMDEVIRATSKK